MAYILHSLAMCVPSMGILFTLVDYPLDLRSVYSHMYPVWVGLSLPSGIHIRSLIQRTESPIHTVFIGLCVYPWRNILDHSVSFLSAYALHIG